MGATIASARRGWLISGPNYVTIVSTSSMNCDFASRGAGRGDCKTNSWRRPSNLCVCDVDLRPSEELACGRPVPIPMAALRVQSVLVLPTLVSTPGL